MQPHFARFREPVRPGPFTLRRFPGQRPFYSGIEQRPFRGGILSRLFGQQIPSRQVPAHPFYFGTRNMASGNSWQNLLNPERITHFLGQTQQVLQTGQQVISLYQQYGPLIRNLPALWKMYRSFMQTDEETEDENKESDTDDLTETDETNEGGQEEPETEAPILPPEQKDLQPSSQNDSHEKEDQEKPRPKKRKRENEYSLKESVPKLYI